MILRETGLYDDFYINDMLFDKKIQHMYLDKHCISLNNAV